MAPVNEYWTVAGVLGHMAYWDLRFQTLAEKIDRGEPWVAGDQEPDGDWLNDSMRPLIHALAPAAAELALRTAEETDAHAASLPLDRLWPGDPDSPISPDRGEHLASTWTRSRRPCAPGATMFRTLDRAPPLERADQGHIVGVLEVAADRQPARDAGHQRHVRGQEDRPSTSRSPRPPGSGWSPG